MQVPGRKLNAALPPSCHDGTGMSPGEEEEERRGGLKAGGPAGWAGWRDMTGNQRSAWPLVRLMEPWLSGVCVVWYTARRKRMIFHGVNLFF